MGMGRCVIPPGISTKCPGGHGFGGAEGGHRRAYLGVRRTRQRTGSDPVGAPIRYGEGTARCTCLSAEEAIRRFQVGTWEAGVE